MTRLLLDSGVWAAAQRTDDPDHPAASQLLDELMLGRLSAGALDLTLYEVANVALKHGLRAASADVLVELVEQSCPDALVRVNADLLHDASRLAERHPLSAYDAAYVAASRALGWPLVSTDRRDLVDPGFAVPPEAYVA